MVAYINNLYERIIKSNGSKFSHLRVITGYSSAKFLEKVLSDFPNMNIELFIGMSLDGISIQNHQLYKQLQQENSKLKVYYQVESPNNHMKIIEFFNEDSKIAFAGSANFSENGFFFQKEIMLETDLNLNSVFYDQQAISKSCLDKEIEQLIRFYNDPLHEKNESDSKKRTPNSNNSSIVQEKKKSYITKMKTLYSKADPRYFEKFELSIVLPATSNWKWDKSGINAWNDGGIVELVETPKSQFATLFPTNCNFKIYMDDGNVSHAQLTGRENKRNLRFLDLNLYEYVATHIGLKTLKPISYEDLLKAESTVLYFTRLNELEYVMSFYKQSY